VHRQLLDSALIEDLNRLACPGVQDQLGGDPARAREALNRLRFLDTSEIDHYLRERWLRSDEAERIESLASELREKLPSVPSHADPIAFTHSSEQWQIAREQARELLIALDAFVDIGVPGWGSQYRPIERSV
jgi:hypothetical protein